MSKERGWDIIPSGIMFDSKDIKLHNSGNSTWATRLSQLGRQKGIVHIVTYSLPNLGYIRKIFNKRPWGIVMIVHQKFRSRAVDLKKEFPDLVISTHPTVHSKAVLIAPETVILSSANFGHSRWHETSITIHSAAAYDYYKSDIYMPLFSQAKKLPKYR